MNSSSRFSQRLEHAERTIGGRTVEREERDDQMKERDSREKQFFIGNNNATTAASATAAVAASSGCSAHSIGPSGQCCCSSWLLLLVAMLRNEAAQPRLNALSPNGKASWWKVGQVAVEKVCSLASVEFKVCFSAPLVISPSTEESHCGVGLEF